MSDGSRAREFGQGPLAGAAALVYTLLVIELLLLLTTAPGLVLLILLDRDASNIPLAALFAVPFGPALSAALFAVHRRHSDLTDLKPAAAFWRGYRLNARGALAIWIPLLALLAIIGVNLSHGSAAGVPGWWRVLLVVIVAVATLWAANALVITSLFAFRARDIARLAVYFLVRTFGATLGSAGVLIVAGVITFFTSEAVLMLLGSLLAAALLMTSRPMIAMVHERFIA